MSDQDQELLVTYGDISSAYRSLTHHAAVLIACKSELGTVTRLYKKALAKAVASEVVHQKEHGSSVEARKAHADAYLASYLDQVDRAQKAVDTAEKKHEVARLRVSNIKLQMQLQGQMVEKQRLDDARQYLDLIATQPSINLIDMVDISPSPLGRGH